MASKQSTKEDLTTVDKSKPQVADAPTGKMPSEFFTLWKGMLSSSIGDLEKALSSKSEAPPVTQAQPLVEIVKNLKAPVELEDLKLEGNDVLLFLHRSMNGQQSCLEATNKELAKRLQVHKLNLQPIADTFPNKTPMPAFPANILRLVVYSPFLMGGRARDKSIQQPKLENELKEMGMSLKDKNCHVFIFLSPEDRCLWEPLDFPNAIVHPIERVKESVIAEMVGRLQANYQK